MSFMLGIALLAILAALLTAAPLWRRQRRPDAALAAVFVLVTAGVVYSLIGRPDLGVEPPQAGMQQPADVMTMIDQLAERLAAAPDDPQGWTMLGRAYVLVGRYVEAASAFSEAMSRTPQEDADLIASFAEARALADPSTLEGEAGTLFERALALDPENPRGLWYGGLAAQARGDDAAALQRWQRLLARDLPPEFRQVVEGRLASIDPSAVGALLTVNIDIDDELRAALPAGGVLFVFLRPAGEAEGGLPLAARRVEFFDFPETVPVTRADLLRGETLPDGELVVSARVSADGDPAPGSGDVEGSTRWSPADSMSVDVRLDMRR